MSPGFQDVTGERERFSKAQRLKIWMAAWIAYWAIAWIGRSMRWTTSGLHYLDDIHRTGRQAIFTFWHGRIFPATWFWRQRDIVVMTSLNFDGELIAQCIRRHGYGAARGSSSRGGFRALAEMVREIRTGHDVAFTIDGPRGPRYVAKQGPVILARKTGSAIYCFHIAIRRKIQLNSWDLFQVPLPFSQAKVLCAPPLWVPVDADESVLRRCHQQMQETLDALRAEGEAWERANG